MAAEHYRVQRAVAGDAAHLRRGECVEANIRHCGVTVHLGQSRNVDEYVWHVPGDCRCAVLQPGEFCTRFANRDGVTRTNFKQPHFPGKANHSQQETLHPAHHLLAQRYHQEQQLAQIHATVQRYDGQQLQQQFVSQWQSSHLRDDQRLWADHKSVAKRKYQPKRHQWRQQTDVRLSAVHRAKEKAGHIFIEYVIPNFIMLHRYTNHNPLTTHIVLNTEKEYYTGNW